MTCINPNRARSWLASSRSSSSTVPCTASRNARYDCTSWRQPRPCHDSSAKRRSLPSGARSELPVRMRASSAANPIAAAATTPGRRAARRRVTAHRLHRLLGVEPDETEAPQPERVARRWRLVDIRRLLVGHRPSLVITRNAPRPGSAQRRPPPGAPIVVNRGELQPARSAMRHMTHNDVVHAGEARSGSDAALRPCPSRWDDSATRRSRSGNQERRVAGVDRRSQNARLAIVTGMRTTEVTGWSCPDR